MITNRLGDTICLLFVAIGRTLFRAICSDLFTDRNDTFNQRLTARFVYWSIGGFIKHSLVFNGRLRWVYDYVGFFWGIKL